MNGHFNRWIYGLVLGLSLACFGTAQAQENQGAAISNALKARNLSLGEVQQRLSAMGYNRNMLDAYVGDGPVPDAVSPEVLTAARALGILEVPQVNVGGPPNPGPDAVSRAPLSAEERDEELRVFGMTMFARTTEQFQPMTTGPVPETYVLGPGDEIVLIITGDIELSYNLPVTREGFIVVPQVGQIWVNGTTLGSFREQMYGYLGRVYSGISRSPNASTRFDVSLGRLRTNQVFITGAVAQPGTYLLSPVASILNGLYQAGGPTPDGSFRDVQILRGGRVAEHVDLYDFLLRGNNLDNIRLNPGDVIFVPPAGAHVAVRGTVRREAIYELKPGETLAHLLFYAGGTTTPASLRHARLNRVLAPGERTVPGVDRTIIDIDLQSALQSPETAPVLRDQDEVTLFAVRKEVRNTIALNGAVWQDGTFAYRPNMRLWDLIDQANGLTPDAYLERGHISRLNLTDSTMSILPFSLRRGADGRPVDNPLLREFDIVRIFSKAQMTDTVTVAISGAVREPGSERFAEGMTLRDLVLRAGGLERTADMTIEIARLGSAEQRESGAISQILHVRVDSTYIISDDAKRNYLGSQALLAANPNDPASQFMLQPYDRVYVRRVPYLEFNRQVHVQGQVKYPGGYSLSHTNERVRDLLLDRSGGLLETAYIDGISLVRSGRSINVKFADVVKNADNINNVRLQPGDTIVVPEYSAVVRVEGNVAFPTAVVYKPGEGIGYYIENAGGYTLNADVDRVSVRYLNGGGETVKRYLFYTDNPDPKPGSTIVVPGIPASERQPFDLRGMIRDVTQILATIGAAVLIIDRTN